MKKTILNSFSFLKVFLLIVLISSGASIYAQSKAFIPDANFRNFLNTNLPTFMDGSGDSLLIDSAATLTSLNCNGQIITDFTGLEHFINITNFSCSGNQLTMLPDLTSNTALEHLDCSSNQLNSLSDLSNNTALQTITCYNNQLTSLTDLTNNTALWSLDCNNNQLTSLPSLTNNAALLSLICYDNQLTSLPDLSGNTALQEINCQNNQLTSLPNLNSNTILQSIQCYNNKLSSLPNLSNNSALVQLNCYNNQLTTLPDLTNNTALQTLYCFNNQITALPDLTNNTSLKQFWYSFNNLDLSDAREMRIADTISTLTMSTYSPQNPFGTPATYELNLGDSIRLSIASQDSALSYQWFRGTDTIVGATDTVLIIPNATLAESGVYSCKSYGTALNSPPMTWGPGISSFVSEYFIVVIGPRLKAYIPDANFRNFINSAYPGLIVGDSLLTDSAATITGSFNCGNQNIFDITGLEWFFNVKWLYCDNNQLTTLPDMSAFTNLRWLHCQNNQLTSLPDLSASTNIQQLYCYNNQLTALPNLSSPNFSLQKLYCEYNQLTSLPDLSSHFALQKLYCNDNLITSLPDLSNSSLIQLNCWRNQLTSLPSLPDNTLKQLSCSQNKITSLPNFQMFKVLQDIYCSVNKLDFSDARELRIIDTISTLVSYIYTQSPFGEAETFNLYQGDTLILSIANQDSALSYQWFKDSDTIVGATDTVLTILNLTLADSGVYTCKSYGTALQSPPMNFAPGVSSFISEPQVVNVLPVPPSASISYQKNVSCNKGTDGEATVSITSGTPPYTLQWSDSLAQTTDTAFNLAEGAYYVVVTDSLNAVDTAYVTITEPLAITGNQSLAICAGDSITVGINVYDSTGVYIDVLTASNSCDSTVTTNLTVNDLLIVSFIGLDTTYCLTDAIATLVGTPVGGTFSGVGISGSEFNPTNADTGTHIITYSYTDVNTCTDSVSKNVTVNNCTGINSQSLMNDIELKIYPNPNTGKFNIEINIAHTGSFNLEIANSLGQKVYTEELKQIKGTYKKHIELNQYPAGIYTIQLLSDKGVINERIIIE